MPIRRRAGHAEEPTLGVAAVARRLGVATNTLRTWDRRYGLGPSGHEAGTRRRYTSLDLARLSMMRRLMLQGVGAADAAAAALGTRERDLPAATEPLATPTNAVPPARRGRLGRGGGGRVVPTRDAGPAARGLARAAMALDSDACTAILRSSVAQTGVVTTWNDVLLPVLAGAGERWRSTGAGVEVEHLLSECAETALRAVPAAGRPRTVRPVLLAALEPEEHRLPLVALGAALAEHQVAVRQLGVRLPARALGDAVSRTGALAVFLWSHGTSGPASVPRPDPLGTVRPRPALVLGGRGWADVPAGATRVDDLAAAVDALLALVTSASPPS
jgi:DNA-binding transcriptional MerR regulator